MLLSVNYTDSTGIFPVPYEVIDKHIKLCSALQLKVVLTALRFATPSADAQKIADCLGVSVSDIEDALFYWEKVGVLRIADDPRSRKPEAEKIEPDESSPPSADSPPQKDEPVQAEIPHSSKTGNIAIYSSRPKIEREEISKLLDTNRDLNAVIREYENVKCKPLTHADMEIITALYSYYGLPGDYILLVIHYCNSLGKLNMRYIEKTAISWLDQEIDSYNKAELHIETLSDRHRQENLVRSAFGIGERALVKKEKDFIAIWFEKYRFDIAMIKLAYENTIPYTGKISFDYTNKILKEWHTKGYKTPKQVAENESAGKPKSLSGSSKSYDISELEKDMWKDFMEVK